MEGCCARGVRNLGTSSGFAGYRAEVTVWGSSNEPGDPSDAGLIADAAAREAEDDAAAERVEVEWAATSWRSLLGHSPSQVELSLIDGSRILGELTDGGQDWSLIRDRNRHVLVGLDHVVTVAGVGDVLPVGSTRRGMGWVLRRWARMRATISVQLVSGVHLHGTVGEVLRDAVVLVLDLDPPRRLLIPTKAIVCAAGDPIVDVGDD